MNLPLHFRVFGHGEDSSFLRAAVRLAAFSLVALPLASLANPQTQTPAIAGSNSPDSNNSTLNNPTPAAVQHVKLLLEKGNPAIEIETTSPVTPQINKSNEGMRLVIDLPNTNMSVADKVVPIKNRDLSEMRLNLLATWPPKVHVEVDFRTKLGYTWDSTGNRILITFHEPGKNEPSEDSSASAPTGGASGPQSVSTGADAVDFAHMVLAERLAAGASVTAGSETTVLRLKHAGDVYVCPQTSVSVVHSKNGPDLMLAMNDGGLETHLALKDTADEVVTPDFRILLRGPGEFDYAIRSDSRGNTCVRTLPGNTASAIIYELLGDGTYNVQAKDQLVFHDGKLSPQAASDPNSGQNVLALECGCPPPERSSLLASVTPAPPLAVENTSASTSTGSVHTEAGPPSTKDSTPSGSPAAPESAAEIRDLPQSLKEQPHLAVEAALTFTPNPGRIAASHLPAASPSRQISSPVSVLPPAPPISPEHKTVFGKIKNFFSRVF